MTKNILILPLLTCTIMHSMETNSLLEITKKSFNIAYYGTNIHVTKESLFEISDKATMTVVGKHQQKMLHSYFAENYEHIYEHIGTTYFPSSPLFQKYEKYDSDSDDDTYKPYESSRLEDTHKHKLTNFKILEKGLLTKIVEPCIIQSYFPHAFFPEKQIKISQYNVLKKNVNSDFSFRENHLGETAIQEASKDLIQCYNNVLTLPIKCGTLNNHICANKLNNPAKPTVALPPLGADVGFPRDKAAPIAITTVIKWIKNNPKAYGAIYFYVKKRSDFARYKLLLMQHTGLLHKICLFHWAHKHDDNSLVSQLPQDVVHYITQLI